MLHIGKQKTCRVGLGAIFTAFLGIFLLTGGTAEAKVKVATTIGMVADLVRQVGGERVEIEQLMGLESTPISTSRLPLMPPA